MVVEECGIIKMESLAFFGVGGEHRYGSVWPVIGLLVFSVVERARTANAEEYLNYRIVPLVLVCLRNYELLLVAHCPFAQQLYFKAKRVNDMGLGCRI
jgi:hypothetical protein